MLWAILAISLEKNHVTFGNKALNQIIEYLN